MEYYTDDRTGESWVNTRHLPSEYECEQMLKQNYEVLHKLVALYDAGIIQDVSILDFLENNTSLLKYLGS